MMPSDVSLTSALVSAQVIERTAREGWREQDAPQVERDAALAAVRKAAELVKMIERWIVVRAQRAAVS